MDASEYVDRMYEHFMKCYLELTRTAFDEVFVKEFLIQSAQKPVLKEKINRILQRQLDALKHQFPREIKLSKELSEAILELLRNTHFFSKQVIKAIEQAEDDTEIGKVRKKERAAAKECLTAIEQNIDYLREQVRAEISIDGSSNTDDQTVESSKINPELRTHGETDA